MCVESDSDQFDGKMIEGVRNVVFYFVFFNVNHVLNLFNFECVFRDIIRAIYIYSVQKATIKLDLLKMQRFCFYE